jgi:hypothetical protein
MKILILYFGQEDSDISKLAESYAQNLKFRGHTVLTMNEISYTYSDELFPSLEKFDPDFGITLDFAGFNLLNTGDDSLLTRFLCPFAHEILMPPYYLNSYLDSRFTFNHVVYCHSASHSEYIQKYFPDVPDVRYCPLPETMHSASPFNTPESILSEINSLPDVFASLCHLLIQDLRAQPDLSFANLVLSRLSQVGIDDLTTEEAKELITMCSLSEEYIRSIGKMPPSQTMPDAKVTDFFLSQANFPSAVT